MNGGDARQPQAPHRGHVGLPDERHRASGGEHDLVELGGMQFNVYSSVQFSVNGKGWSTDFKTIARDTAYDEKE